MPAVTAANINVTVIAIAETAADLVTTGGFHG
jgi:choline dehydrogenase-like flavoprotein